MMSSLKRKCAKILNFPLEKLSHRNGTKGKRSGTKMDKQHQQGLVWAEGWGFESFPAEDPCGVYLVEKDMSKMWFIFDRTTRKVVAVPDREEDTQPLQLGDILNSSKELELHFSGYELEVAAA